MLLHFSFTSMFSILIDFEIRSTDILTFDRVDMKTSNSRMCKLFLNVVMALQLICVSGINREFS